MEELMTINRLQNAENKQLKAENKLLWNLLELCFFGWIVSEAAFIYLAYH